MSFVQKKNCRICDWINDLYNTVALCLIMLLLYWYQTRLFYVALYICRFILLCVVSIVWFRIRSTKTNALKKESTEKKWTVVRLEIRVRNTGPNKIYCVRKTMNNFVWFKCNAGQGGNRREVSHNTRHRNKGNLITHRVFWCFYKHNRFCCTMHCSSYLYWAELDR